MLSRTTKNLSGGGCHDVDLEVGGCCDVDLQMVLVTLK